MVDGTLGSGGHTEAMLQRVGLTGKLIGFDQDPDAIARCQKLFGADPRVILVHENFRYLDKIFKKMNVTKVDSVLFDLGISSEQLADGSRGFSFQSKGELDMRMNPEIGPKASELLAKMSEKELADLFYHYGEESKSRRFARAVVETRRRQPIQTCDDLIRVVEQALPFSLRFQPGKRPVWARRHPATRLFQALRIAVNDELNALKEGLCGAWIHLRCGGRLGVISFHSLEDRIVKHQFREWEVSGQGKSIFRKPIVAKRSEIFNNSKSRSAKFRVIEKKYEG